MHSQNGVVDQRGAAPAGPGLHTGPRLVIIAVARLRCAMHVSAGDLHCLHSVDGALLPALQTAGSKSCTPATGLCA